MGLDGVEFVMALEEAFGLAIPDSDAERLVTPGHVVRYLEGRLQAGTSGCLEQRAFYALRRAAMSVLHLPRSAFRPETQWEPVLGSRHRRHTWKLLHSATGVAPWPKMSVWGSIPASAASMGDTARYLASYGVPSLQRHGEGWSTAQIQTTVTRLMADTLGIEKFDWDQSFVQDLGIN